MRTRLAGSTPRHDASQWLVPGMFEPISASQRRRLPQDPVPAAVLIPLIERPGLTVLFTQRATQLRNHAGQISFTGGRIGGAGGSPSAAALRGAGDENG